MIGRFYIKEVSWSTHEAALRQIREQVFIVEQHVAEDLEWDAYDADADHLLAIDHQAQPIACARIVDGSIGRMAVIKDWRCSGVGKALLGQAIKVCQERSYKNITLSAQTHAIQFYENAGFVVSSKPYLDANIWHVDMQLNI